MTLRQRIAAFALAALTVAGSVYLADPGTPADPTVSFPSGYKDLYLPLGGPAICSGLNCDDPAPGLETSLCELQGVGVVRVSGGDKNVEGLYYEAKILPKTGTSCVVHLRQHRAQELLARSLEPTDADYAAWQHIANAARARSELTAGDAAVVDGHGFAGQTKDDRDIDLVTGRFPDAGAGG